jgi:hypothetical protein
MIHNDICSFLRGVWLYVVFLFLFLCLFTFLRILLLFYFLFLGVAGEWKFNGIGWGGLHSLR